MKKGTLVVISTLLVVMGLILLVSSLSITGNVISEKVGKTGSILGLVFIIGGFGLFVVATSKRPVKYHLKPLEDILSEAGTPGKSVFILDSSGAIDYENEIQDILREYSGEVYVPDEIMRELGRGFRNKYGERIKTLRSPQYGKYAKIARKRLEETQKHQDYLLYLKGKKRKLTPREHEKLIRKISKIRMNLEEGEEDNPKKVEEYIEKYWKVSRGDVTVLASAINAARQRKKANILAEDTHIRDAIANIKRKNPEIGKNINYIDYREYVEAA